MNMKTNKNTQWQLYNLTTDGIESNDLSSAHPEIIKKLDEIVSKEHRNSHVREWEFVNPKF